ncbi:MAG: hypothetical protein KDD94_01705 [Calditrichaeota bacterium]|nr:hypothetical protein [Calditrichota bacterium]
MKLLSLILVFSWAVSQDDTVQHGNDTVFYNHIKFLEEQGDDKYRDYIITEYRRFLNIFPNSTFRADVLFNIANRYHISEEYDISLVYYLKIVMLFPNFKNPQIMTQIEQIIFKYEQSRYSNVADFINKEMRQARTEKEIDNLFQFLKVLSAFADDEQLILLRENIEEYISKFPDSINLDTIFILLAKSYEREKNFKHAMIHYLAFTKLFKESEQRPFVLMQMAGIFQNEFSEYYNARKYYKEFVTSYPKNEQAHEAQFKAAFLLDDDVSDYDAALVEYEYYLSNYADKSHAMECLKRIAVIYYNRENYPKAVEAYKRGVDNYRSDPRASEYQKEIISISKNRLNNLDKAIDEMVNFADYFPEHEDSSDYLYDAVENLIELNNREKALTIATKLKNAFPNSSNASKVDELFNSPN